MKTPSQVKMKSIDNILTTLYAMKDKSENLIKVIQLLEDEQLDILLLDLAKNS